MTEVMEPNMDISTLFLVTEVHYSLLYSRHSAFTGPPMLRCMSGVTVTIVFWHSLYWIGY